MNRRNFLKTLGKFSVAMTVNPFNALASSNDPLSEKVEDKIIERGGIIEWDKANSEVIYQTNKDWEKYGSIKKIIVGNLDTNLYNYSAQSGGDNESATRYFLTSKFITRPVFSYEATAKIRERGGIVEWNKDKLALLYQSYKNEDKFGSLKGIILQSLNRREIHYSAQSGRHGEEATRYFVGLK
jgi:hypothetical protein